MFEEIERVLRDACRLEKDAPIVVGVSGGPDSMCLLDLLCRTGYQSVVAYFDHQLRPESSVETEILGEHAWARSIPFATGRGDVGAYAAAKGVSIETAARELRYEFLFAEARGRHAQAVAVGHTADDQIETVLMHFIRGSGLRGLTGMSARTVIRAFDPAIPLVRPLLGFWRRETEAYCAQRGLRVLRDPSNDSADYFRNRVRHQLIPTLQRINPHIRDILLRNAAALASDQDLLDEVVATAWEQVLVRAGPGFLALDWERIRDCSTPMQRQLIRKAFETLAPTEQLDHSALDRAIGLLASPSGQQADLVGGLRLLRESDALFVTAPHAELPSEVWPQMPSDKNVMEVLIPGGIALSAGWRFEADAVSTEARAEPTFDTEDRFLAEVDAATLPDGLQLRVRRPGDRIQPLGLRGNSQKLSDFFVNQKVPARARTRWPVLCAGEDVIWVPGYRMAEPYKLLASSSKVARFRVRPPSSS